MNTLIPYEATLINRKEQLCLLNNLQTIINLFFLFCLYLSLHFTISEQFAHVNVCINEMHIHCS